MNLTTLLLFFHSMDNKEHITRAPNKNPHCERNERAEVPEEELMDISHSLSFSEPF